MITLEDALINAKKFIAKLKGLDVELSGVPLIDYLDFTPLKTIETPNDYVLIPTILLVPYIYEHN